MALSTIEKVRLEIGDENGDLFTDVQIESKLEDAGDDINEASAMLCEILARRYARQVDITTAEGESFKLSQKAKGYAEQAETLRSTSNTLNISTFTKVDGYTEDIDNHEGAGQNSKRGRVAIGYTNPDLPF